MKDDLIKTRKITKEEAENCANEEVQYIGKIQPHGFVLIVDKRTEKIIQHSENVLSLINRWQKSQLSIDKAILGAFFNDWMNVVDKEKFYDSLLPNATQLVFFDKGGIISPDTWECLGVKVDDYILLEFFPSSKKESSYKILSNLDRMVSKIRLSKSLDELYTTFTEEFQKHTKYDRVMMYKFHPDWSGEVMAEAVSKNTEIKFRGLRFPSEDIPKKARELYLTSSLRILADVDSVPVDLNPPRLPSGERTDLTYSVLRGMSLMHIEYLKNMGVQATMSIALKSHDKLWGLLAFHHYSPKVPPNHLVSEMKASCELFSEVIISYLQPAIDLEAVKTTLDAKMLINKMFKFLGFSTQNTKPFMNALLKISRYLKKDFVGVCCYDSCFLASDKGVSENKELGIYIEKLLKNHNGLVFESNKLLIDDSKYPLFKKMNIAGILIKKNEITEKLYVFFGKHEVEKTIDWGGKPETVNIRVKNGVRALEPRSSFSLWREKVFGTSDEWIDSDKELLEYLSAVMQECLQYNKNQQIQAKLREASYKDELTGLPNRRYLQEFIQNTSLNDRKSKQMTILFLDLDNFKNINDYLGHQAGDFVLEETAKRIQKCVRGDDSVFRFGGDEFIVLIQHINDDVEINRKSAELVAEKIREELNKPFFESGHAMVTTPSIGALTFTPIDIEFQEVLKRADIAMYHAKNSGKNNVHFFDRKDQDKVIEENELSLALRKAISNKDGIELHYQAQVNQHGCITGAEVLARWALPKLGSISPIIFISLAEKYNLINELGEYIFDKACAQMAAWKKNKQLKSFETLSINISPLQVQDILFEDKIEKTVKKHGLKNQDIRLELTETLFMKNFKDGSESLERLRAKGFSISLDDFGTGFSSLSYLLKLPIDEVKIDQSFIKNMQQNEESLTMVEGIITLCKKMGFEVVAEGVENKVQVNILKGFKCETLQGFYFQKPVPAEEFKFDLE